MFGNYENPAGEWHGFTYDGTLHPIDAPFPTPPDVPFKNPLFLQNLIPPVPIPPFETTVSAFSGNSAAGLYVDDRSGNDVPFVFDGQSYFTADPFGNYSEVGVVAVSGDMAVGYDFDRGIIFIGQTPEPGSLLLLSIGAAALVGSRKIRRLFQPWISSDGTPYAPRDSEGQCEI